jgi:hypothetical protein
LSSEIKSIETHYNGYRFRSRLEARWAVFFETVGIKYEYEKEGYDLGKAGFYLPDFWFPELNMWAEVKGQEFTEDEENKAKALSEVETLFHGNPGKSYGVIKLIGLPDYCYINGYFNTINGPRNENFLFIYSSNPDYPVKPSLYSELLANVIFPIRLSKREIDNQIRESKKLYDKGIKAAKSARFEHGEKPLRKETPIEKTIFNQKSSTGELKDFEWVKRPEGITDDLFYEIMDKACRWEMDWYDDIDVTYNEDLGMYDENIDPEDYFDKGFIEKMRTKREWWDKILELNKDNPAFHGENSWLD